MKSIRTLYASLVASAALPLTAFAQFGQQNFGSNPFSFGITGGFNGGYGGGFGQTRPATIGSFDSLMLVAQRLLGYFQVVIFITALFFMLRGALLYVRGNAKDAQPMILNAVIGIVVALLVFTVIPLACWITQSSGPACGV